MTEQTSRLQIVIDSGDAEKRINDLRKQLRELGGAADRAADDTSDLGNRADRASRDTNRLNASAESGKKALDGMAKAAALAGVALVGAIGLGINQAKKFETAMAEVNKTVDFASSDGLSNLKMELIELSKTIPLTFEELAAVAASGGQLGIAEKDLRGFTETVSKMAIAFDMSADDAGDAMAKLANVFEIPISEIDKLGDAINTLSNNSPAKASEIVNAMSRVGGLAKQFGLTEDATAALTSTFVALGKPAEIAASAVNSMLITFSTLDMASKSQLIGFEKLGVNIDEFAQRVKVDGKAAIYEFLEAVNQLPQEDRIGVIAPIIGRDFGDDVAALAGNMGLLDKQMALVGETADSTKIYIGSMETEFVKMAATSANATTLFKNRTDALTATMGEAFLPVLNDLLLKMAPVIDKITVWAQANPELIRTIALVSASALGFIVSLKLLADGFTAAKTTVDGLKLAYTALASPMGLTIIALGALLAAGVLVYQNWDEIKQVVSENQGVFTALAVTVSALTVALIAANAPLIALRTLSAIAAVQAGVMTVATSAWSVAAGIAAAATWTFNAALAVLTSPILLVIAAIAGIAYMGYQVVKNWGAISAGLKSEFERIKGAVMLAVNGMQAAWDSAIVSTRAAFIRIGNSISTTLKELPGRILTIGKQIVQGLISGITGGASSVVSAIGNMASSAIAKAKSVLDIHSPSRVMNKIGLQTAKGMENGIKKGAKAVKTEAQKMAEGAIEAVQTGIDRIKKELALFGNNSNLADLEYDIKVGKYNGASDAKKTEYRNAVAELEAKTKLAAANKTVQDSIDGLMKQQALFGNNSSLASLMYDIEHTDKYKDATEALTTKLKEQTRAFEQLSMTAKATAAIQARFAQLGKDKEASQKAVDGVMTELVNESPMAKIEADYARRLEIIATNEMLETGIIGSEVEKRLAIEQSYQDAKRNLMLTQGEALFGDLAGLAKGFAGEQSGIYKALFAVEKGFAIAQSAIAIQQSVAKAMALGFPQNIPVIGQAISQGASIMSSIKGITTGFKDGGYTGNMGTSSVAGVVHGQEYVFDAQSTKRIGVDNLNAMRSGKSVGGDVQVNIINNSSARVQASNDGKTITISDVNNAVDRKFDSLANPNSHASKVISRNINATRRR